MARSKRWVGRVVALVVVLAAAGGGWWYLFGRPAPPPRFQTTTISRGSIQQSVTASGTLQPVISVDVGSQVSGRIVELTVDFNSAVKQGMVLARIDTANFEAAVSQAESELSDARARLKLARANLERSLSLFEQNLVSKAELEQQEAAVEQAETSVKIRTFALDTRRTDLERCTIYAPIDGIVISRNIQAGQTVAASLNSPTLFIIANDLAKMQIAAAISEADVGIIKEDLDVTFTVDAFPGRTFNGQVRQVRNAPKTVDSVVTYETIIDVDNPGGLKPGMTANVSIIIERRESVVRVANAALRVRLPEGIQPTNRAPAPVVVVAANTATPAADGSAAPPAVNGEGRRGGATGGAAGSEGGQRAGRRGRGEGNGGMGRGGEGAFGRGMGGERAATPRVVYKFTGTDENPAFEEVRIRTGISDNAFTEVLDGLQEGDRLVTAVIVPGASALPTAQQGRGNQQGGIPGMGGGNRGGGFGGGGGRF